MTQNLQQEFEAIPMPRRDAAQLFGGSYRVYKTPRDYIVVSAGSALEALQMSGLGAAYKIERESMDNISVLPTAFWRGEQQAQLAHATAQAPDSSAKQAASQAEANKDTVLLNVAGQAGAEGAEAETLSNDDVQKLLNG